jgi:hypothetical protein
LILKVLEAELRRNSQLVRVVDTLPGKACAIFPSSDSTIALRLYDLDKPVLNDNQFQEHVPADSTTSMQNLIAHGLSCNDYDDLRSFQNSFKFPVIFFLSLQSQQDVLTKYFDNPHSLLHRVQDALVCDDTDGHNQVGYL